ncbi:PAS/PAC domain-containing protein [Yersinia ruckeri]|uniref:sensor domain-containing diguanylate cyclase n=1 Tax=Yersinia ruckeri TaxID=29486 RepID=UPI0005E9B49C|nr:diguanylate cyclase [Yersinia ruckeri]EKN4196617.1 diguanylate cyclase [Yersinia ruckeri]EKN4203271.1 diguanylate cyclase [Yersinia ruckeri]EKN4700888.1 diguanylate cyclase [Yersinia ruckeri]EKN4703925.1 diguanylate cyclase [Yersinia ruckeri]CNB14634.1 PAS/PAC domain-containing protein [Yersinia ruckeri]
MGLRYFYLNSLRFFARKTVGSRCKSDQPCKKDTLLNLQLESFLSAETQVAIITTDLENRIRTFNIGAERMFGIDKQEVLGHQITDVISVDSGRGEQASVSGRENAQPEASEWLYQRKNGESFWGTLSLHVINDDQGKPIGYINLISDISERKELLIKLENSQKLMNRLTRNIPAMIYAYYLSAEGDSYFKYCSDGIKKIFGLSPQEVINIPKHENPIFSLIHPADRVMLRQQLEISQRDLSVWSCDFRVTLPQKGMRWLHGESFPTQSANGITVWYGSFFDITELKQSESILKALAQTDVLTGVANRRHFDEIYRQTWQMSQSSGESLSVLMIDFDNFKSFNDLYGHGRGDICLKLVVETLSSAIRENTDVLARYGGEEFIVLLSPCNSEEAWLVAERMRYSIEKLDIPHAVSPKGKVTISIGVATIVPTLGGLTPAEVSDCADKALYRAKIAGKNRVEAILL